LISSLAALTLWVATLVSADYSQNIQAVVFNSEAECKQAVEHARPMIKRFYRGAAVLTTCEPVSFGYVERAPEQSAP